MPSWKVTQSFVCASEELKPPSLRLRYAKEVGEKIKQAGSSVFVDRRISAITSFTKDNFSVSEISNVKIFTSKKLKNHSQINRKFEDWFSTVPQDDLADLSRLYSPSRF